ncbi:MAG: serine hydrolase [Acidobacteriota bacterium]|nr:MAG: serine hydrolase [Acidobacteriota bacterium]
MKQPRRFLALAVLFNLFLASLVLPQSPPKSEDFADEIRKIEQFVEAQMKRDGSVGLSIGFSKDGFVWTKGFGYADLENKTPAKADSSYRMASVTKTFTAAAVLKLVEEGKIDLDAEVQKYVPYFPKKQHPVTVRQLLGHLGGISHYRNYLVEGRIKEPMTTRESIAIFEDFDLVAEPGTRYNYSSYGFNLLGAVIEGASGRSYGEYLTESVWKPLGMKATRLDDPLEIIPNRVRGYQVVGGELKNSEFVDISSRFAGGGTRSTVADMLAFADGLREGKLLKPETVNEMWTAQTTKGGRDIGYGYGWGTDTANGRFVVGHGGAQQEARTYLLTVPHENFSAAVAINFEPADSAFYAQKVFEIVLGEPWSIQYFAPDPTENAILEGLDGAFDFGMRYFDQHRRAATEDPGELAKSFAYLNSAVEGDPGTIRQKLDEGRHPLSGEPLVKVISHIAATLASMKGGSVDEYYRKGVPALLDDYSVLASEMGGPTALRLDPALRKNVSKWALDWRKTSKAVGEDLAINADTNLEEISGRLSEAFKGASVYPDLVSDIDNLVRARVVAGDVPGALKAGRMGVELYPSSATTNGLLGVLYVVTGNNGEGVSLLRKSAEISPNGMAGRRGLNGVAYDLASAGQTEAGLRLLMTAIGMYPDEANLYDSAGDFHRRMGNRDKAIEFYEKALSIDGNYPAAEAARKILAELKGTSQD